MILPKEIELFGKVFTVTEKKKIMYEGDECEGLFLPDTCEIYIKKDLNRENKVKTFIHELGHAMIWRTGLKQSNLSEELEEIIVENYSTFLWELFDLRLNRK